MPSFPRFRLYASNGTSLIYEFVNVIDINDFQDPTSFVEHTSLRGIGSVISEGSEQSWDLTIPFLLFGAGSTAAEKYEDLVSQIQNIQNAITKFTPFILKVDLAVSGSTKDYHVKRITSIEFPNNRGTKRVNLQDAIIHFHVNSW